MKTKPFNGQVAIVTGGGTGMGSACSEALGACGLQCRDRFATERCVAGCCCRINATLSAERVFPYDFDIRKSGDATSLVRDVFERWQTIDVLINNSGLAVPETVDSITDDGWDKVLETNLRGAMQLVRAVCRTCVRNDFGDIVNVSSQAGKAWLCRCSVLLCIEVWVAWVCRSAAGSRAQIWSEHSRLQFLSRPGGRREHRFGSGGAAGVHPRDQHGAHSHVRAFAGSRSGPGRYQYLCEIAGIESGSFRALCGKLRVPGAAAALVVVLAADTAGSWLATTAN